MIVMMMMMIVMMVVMMIRCPEIGALSFERRAFGVVACDYSFNLAFGVWGEMFT